MPPSERRRRDPNFTTGHLCRFCGELVPWGTILRVIRVDPDTPGYVLNETACHTECLARQLRPGMDLTFPRHWGGRTPYLDDNDDIFISFPAQPIPRSPAKAAVPPEQRLRPCAMCGEEIAASELVRLRIQKPVGPVKRHEFHEQSLPVHFECLARVSTTRWG